MAVSVPTAVVAPPRPHAPVVEERADGGQVVVSNPGQPRQLKRLTIEVPPGAKPGETQLRVTPGDTDFSLQIVVPHGAAAGDRLVLAESNDGDWACRVLQRQSDGSTGPRVRQFAGSAPPPQPSVASAVEAPPGRMPSPATRERPMTIFLTHPEIDDDGVYDDIVKTARASGSFVSDKLRRGAAPPLKVLGLITTEEIAEGEELLRIPAGIHVSPATCRQLMPELWNAVEAHKRISESRRTETALTACTAELLRFASAHQGLRSATVGRCWRMPTVWPFYSEALLGENFESHPYWKALCHRDMLRAVFEPSCEAEHARTMAGDSIAIWELIMEDDIIREIIPDGEAGLFLQAKLCLLSREFGTPHGSALVPVVDFCNHSENPGVHQSWDLQTDTFVVKALRAHKAGEEICITYGRHSCPILWRTYGFVLPPRQEPRWTFACQACEFQHWCSTNKDDCEGAHAGELAAALGESFPVMAELQLESEGLTDSIRAILRAGKSTGCNAEAMLRGFVADRLELYGKDLRLQPPLAALRRARNAEPQSGAWWDAVDEEDPISMDQVSAGSLEEQALWIKMSEYLCLTVHVEALDLSLGRHAREELCLEPAVGLSRALLDFRKERDEEQAAGK
eukprot:CAMPEP_0172700252 /NCGR_PEP_ID=MMETSP1074-20121228/30770_1 /TAXON_ID=2916 /ORGANISM="Ceratium fusus, Strain PA161109" /LENGTH=625 /DNA_ID=CAMNT_0013521601 /DNA_START=56 /DNA_END=1933 /DNA_ORIENTATION=+